MSFYGHLKKFLVDIFSDEEQIVCTHCGWRATYDMDNRPIRVCNSCGSRDTICFVGTLPVCSVCDSHSYHLECPRCGRPIE